MTSHHPISHTPDTILADYLLSNNHVNSIIVHKFDFSDEEVMAYYISFLKTLSLKLNTHTVHFFYNEVRMAGDWEPKRAYFPAKIRAHKVGDVVNKFNS